MLEKNPDVQKAFNDLAIDKNISPSTKDYQTISKHSQLASMEQKKKTRTFSMPIV